MEGLGLGETAQLLDLHPMGSQRLGEVSGPNPRDEIGIVERMHQINTMVIAGRVEEALAALMEMDDSPWVETLKGVAALRAGRLDIARAVAQRRIEEEPSRPFARPCLRSAWCSPPPRRRRR